MMSKKQWFVLLCLFVVYLLLGAGIFYNIESQEETKRLDLEKQERIRIEALLKEYIPNDLEKFFFQNLSEYCGKPLQIDMGSIQGERRWDFYHSLFFVITVVSTIGYGNLAPTTMFGRIFMIFYALIGIPMNGIVMVTLGDFFGRSFTKLYHRWKTAKMKYDAARLGLISQIILYLVPGFTFFIFLPAVIMTMFEGWAYDVAVYYSFVTLTTIGFGDYVAGVTNVNSFTPIIYTTYQIFLLIWVIGGLGYVVMILNFITRAMRSKKMQAIEHIISHNIKKTPIRIRHELRTLLQEFLFLRVKRVYKGEFEYTPTLLERSQSCPDLTIYRNMNSPTMVRKRAFSECPRTFILHRIQSDTDLERIDKDRTFQSNDAFLKQQDLIRKVVDALGTMEPEDSIDEHAYEGLSDAEILKSEKYGSQWSLRSQNLTTSPPKRRRAVSEVKVPPLQSTEVQQDLTWYGQEAAENLKNFKPRARTFSEPSTSTIRDTPNLLTRLKNKLIPLKDERLIDIEKQQLDRNRDKRRVSIFTDSEDRYIRKTNDGRPSALSVNQETVLEQTSIADFIRALSAITVPETMLPSPSAPKRKLGTAGLSPPKTLSPPRARRLAIRPNMHIRRASLMPEMSVAANERRRRFSLSPVDENVLAPPPYSPSEQPLPASSASRRFSRTLNTTPGPFVSPVQRQVNKKEKEDN